MDSRGAEPGVFVFQSVEQLAAVLVNNTGLLHVSYFVADGLGRGMEGAHLDQFLSEFAFVFTTLDEHVHHANSIIHYNQSLPSTTGASSQPSPEMSGQRIQKGREKGCTSDANTGQDNGLVGSIGPAHVPFHIRFLGFWRHKAATSNIVEDLAGGHCCLRDVLR